MNISLRIIEFLKKYHKAKIPYFGTFTLKNTPAELSKDGKILPPTTQIDFSPDFEIHNSDFTKYISQTENVSVFDAELGLKKITNQWKNKLDAGQEVEIPQIGTIWNNENSLQFKGERLENASPDFYGLEEISLAELKQRNILDNETSIKREEIRNYRFNNTLLWIFLIIIPVSGLLYFVITKQEILFGKKYFDEVSIKTSTRRILKDTAKIDSTKSTIQDSTKNDFLKNTATSKNNINNHKNSQNKSSNN